MYNKQLNIDKKYSEMEKFFNKEKFLDKKNNLFIIVSPIVKTKYIMLINKYFPYLFAAIKFEK